MIDTVKQIVNFLKIPITYLQVPLLYFSYYFFKIFKKKNNNSWVIGVDEIASIIFSKRNN